MRIISQEPKRRRRRGTWRGWRLGLLATLSLASVGLAQASSSVLPAHAAPMATISDVPEPPPVLFGCVTTTGTTLYQVPPDVSTLQLVVNGGSGGTIDSSDAGSSGAQLTATISVRPADTLELVVGCAANGRSGGAGYSHGGNGGFSNVQTSGSGGGGSSAILLPDGTPLLVAGGGGGSGGGSGLARPANGGVGSLLGENGDSGHGSGSAGHGRGGGRWNAPSPNGQDGYGSKGGGGGGGGAGGYPNGGSGGRGGSCFGCGGGGGGGGQSYAGPGVTQVKVTAGGAQQGDGSVLIVPALAGLPLPLWSVANCGGVGTTFTTPAYVTTLQVVATGASGGSDSIQGIQGGLGAEVQATLSTTAGTQYTLQAGCAGIAQSAPSSGYGQGGNGGSGTANNENGSAGGGGSALLLGSQPLLVAGAGGGAGGVGDDAATPGAGGGGSQNGDGGLSSSGGAGGAGGGAAGSSGVNGGSGAGGGGGGGGGYHGGNGGHSGSLHSGGGGGGGSSFTLPSATNVSIQDAAAPRGNGMVVIEWLLPTAPGTPTSIVAFPGTASASVSFLAPASDGGTPITGYVVTARPGGVTASGAGSPLSVGGLVPGRTYTFTVQATNVIGSSPASAPSAAIEILNHPAAPTNVVATPGNASATVSFTPPTDIGGQQISSYTVTAHPGGATATGAASPLTVNGLVAGSTYTFTVRATNSIGTSPPSAPSSSLRLPTVPGAPIGVSAAWVAGQSGQAAVSFTPPANNGGAPISSYTIMSSVGGNTVTSPASAGTTIVLSGLTAQIPYTFTVRATNLAGDGPLSAPSAPITYVAPPSPPLYPTATLSGTQALVSFLAPLSNGGSAVLDYTATSSPGGVTVTGNPAPDQGGNIVLTVTGLVRGTTYTFAVTARNAAGSSQAQISNAVTPPLLSAPANDNFSVAQPISSTTGTITGTTIGATKEPGEPDHDGNPGGASVWYVWTAPANVGGSVTFDTCGSNYSTLLAAYQGTSVDNLNLVPSPSIGIPQGCSAGGQVIRFDVPYSGGTYYIAVDGASGVSGPAEGNLVLNWTQSA